MKHITDEFYRAHRSIPLRFLIVSAICVAAFFFTGTYSRENTRLLAIIFSALLGLLTIWALVDVLTAPMIFKKQLGKLPENERKELVSGLESASKLGKRWFSESYLVYFAKRRIRFVRYDELESAELKGSRLFLKLADGSETPLPFEVSENPAILVAALRSKNGKMKAFVNGKNVDFEKRGRNGDKK